MSLIVEYMSFDLSWFTTKEGIFITGGLVLLLIGLILYILTGKKDKGEKAQATTEVKVEDVPTTVGDVGSSSEPTPVVVPQAEENIVQQNGENLDVVTTNPEVVNEPVVEPVEVLTPVASAEVVVPAAEVAPVVPVENNEVVETPVEQVAAETPVETVTPTTQEVVTVPVVEETPAQENTVSIYGGVSPQVNLAPAEEPKKVYGGADPLENTGALPRVEVPVDPVVTSAEVATPASSSTPEVVVPTVGVPVVEPAEPVAEPVVVTSPVVPSGDIETLEF